MGKAWGQEGILPWVSLLSISHAHVWMLVVCLTSWTWLHVVSDVATILIEVTTTAYHLVLILVLRWLVAVHIILVLVNLVLVYEFTGWHAIWVADFLKRDVTEGFLIVDLIDNIAVNVGHYLWLLYLARASLLLLVNYKAVYG